MYTKKYYLVIIAALVAALSGCPQSPDGYQAFSEDTLKNHLDDIAEKERLIARLNQHIEDITEQLSNDDDLSDAQRNSLVAERRAMQWDIGEAEAWLSEAREIRREAWEWAGDQVDKVLATPEPQVPGGPASM